jgi:DNA mismatch repair protein MutS
MSDTIYHEYFQIAKDSSLKYGDKTVLLMQVGAFLEIYGLTPQPSTPKYKTQIFDVCTHCDLNISEKKIQHEGSPIYMAGFRDFSSEKYIQKLVDVGYTVVVYLQEKNERNTKRIFHSVYSPGTYIPYETDHQLTNNIMCIWMELYTPLLKKSDVITSLKSNINYGVALSNIYTGQSHLFEHQVPYTLTPSTFDEMERIVSVHNPSEIIVCSSFDDDAVRQILQFAGVKTTTIHMKSLNDPVVQNCARQTYIQHILASMFGEETYQICSEFTQYPVATQSFIYLLNFIKEHNPNLVRNIFLPTFENTSYRVVLANHTLKQLNIIDDASNDGKHAGQLSSVSTFLNKCCSAIGRRKFHTTLVNPTFDIEWLKNEYSMIEYMLEQDQYMMIPMIRKQITSLCDIEKVARQLVTQRIYPCVMYKLYKSLETMQQIHTCFYESSKLVSYLCSEMDIAKSESPQNYIVAAIEKTMECLQKHLNLDACAQYNTLSSFEESIIQWGVSPKLDSLLKTKREEEQQILKIQKYLNEMYNAIFKGTQQTQEYVKIHETEKSGVSLQITKVRAKVLKQQFEQLLKENAMAEFVVIGEEKQVKVPISEITFKSLNATTDEIKIPVFNTLSQNILDLNMKINAEMVCEYSKFLKLFETQCYTNLENIAKYIAKLDVLQSKTYVAKEYKYCKPNIQENAMSKSFVDVKGLRHCLIEHLQTSEIYVANDVCIGSETDGILLYGTNAVGKTSFIRALGISLIMAQSGLYVPCSEFMYSPYTAFFSRILGNDNIFKGLSTFAVEMTELRMILNMADRRSFIMGDELCSGTETESALSIFMAGLMDLHSKQSSFIFATHFHEIVKFDEMKQLTKLALKHMAVIYDREHDCLVYDRKLQDGPGNKMYGLEVCKSLHLPTTFLEKAYEIRSKYYPEAKGDLQHSQTKYNAKKLKGMCERCFINPGEEIHHIQEQQFADENGYIGHFHKNHPANLMSLCETCHAETHHPSLTKTEPVKKKKTTNGKMILTSSHTK